MSGNQERLFNLQVMNADLQAALLTTSQRMEQLKLSEKSKKKQLILALKRIQILQLQNQAVQGELQELRRHQQSNFTLRKRVALLQSKLSKIESKSMRPFRITAAVRMTYQSTKQQVSKKEQGTQCHLNQEIEKQHQESLRQQISVLQSKYYSLSNLTRQSQPVAMQMLLNRRIEQLTAEYQRKVSQLSSRNSQLKELIAFHESKRQAISLSQCFDMSSALQNQVLRVRVLSRQELLSTVQQLLIEKSQLNRLLYSDDFVKFDSVF